MKLLVSATGSPIEFNLSFNRHLVFDTIVPIPVEDDEYLVLVKRLGVQLKEVPDRNPLTEPVNPDVIIDEGVSSIHKTPVIKPKPVVVKPTTPAVEPVPPATVVEPEA